MHSIHVTDRSEEGYQLAWAIRPFVGERVSGDLVWSRRVGERVYLCVIDALGHGSAAADAAAVLARQLSKSVPDSPAELIANMHEAGRGTVGAAASVLIVDVATATVELATVGNTTVSVVSSRASRTMVSSDGIVGQQIGAPMIQSHQLRKDEIILCHTDGVQSGLGASDVARVLRMSARAAARFLLRSKGKTMDDASVVVFRLVEP